MIYTKIHNYILIENCTPSESTVYSVLRELDGITISRDERLISLLARCSHAMTRVTINTAIRSLIKKGYIDTHLYIRQLPTDIAIPAQVRTKSGRPHAHRSLPSTDA